jgi:DNA topoisomerase-1
MSQYCFDIENSTGEQINEEGLKKFIRDLYIKDKSKDSFKDLSIDDLPYVVIHAKYDNSVCILMTSCGKKNVEKIEAINNRLKSKDLKYGNLRLSEPYFFDVEAQVWWGETQPIKKGKRWTSLRQRGPYFSYIMDPYAFLGSSLIYEGKKYALSPKEEKIASFYAKRLISEMGGGVTEEMTKDKIFNRNFWNDFKDYLSSFNKKILKDFNKISWRDIISKIETKKIADSEISKSEKREKKVLLEEKKREYGYAFLDNHREKVGNYNVEPSAIFYGRGNNPNRGRIKTEVRPEDVTINIGPNDEIPEPPIGHSWGSVVHDQKAIWLARWIDSISREVKYVMFSAEGRFKGEGDFLKYEKARKLERHIETVRENYILDAVSSDMVKKQLGTVLFLIDHYGIRVGNEKSEEETDTVGASTLRVDHVKLRSPNHVIFDFLGKDSIRFYKDLEVPRIIYENFELFLRNKSISSDVFDIINSKLINTYLKNFDKAFSAKVFRTRLASVIMFEALEKVKVPKNSTKTSIKALFNRANAKVADVLNHTRSISKKASENVEKNQNKLKELKKEKSVIKKSGKSLTTINNKIESLEIKIKSASDTMAVAITTSLNNYIDPRLVVAWAKKQDVDLTTIYTSTLMRKFKWAISTTNSKWNYLTSPLLGNSDLEPVEECEKDVKVPSKKSPSRRTSFKVPSKKSPSRKTTFKVPSKKSPSRRTSFKVPSKKIENIHEKEQFKIILNFCLNPMENAKNLDKISKQFFKGLYLLNKYAFENNMNPRINRLLMIYYEKNFN